MWCVVQSRVSGVVFALVLLAAVLLPSSSRANLPDIVVDVDDTSVYPGDNVALLIYLSNYSDTVAGFDLWLQLDRPDIALFQTDTASIIDTTYWKCLEYSGPVCVDSQMTFPWDSWDFIHVDTNIAFVGCHDTSGTLLSGWEYVQSRNLSGFGYDLNIVGLANMVAPPLTPGIAPQEDGVLIKVLLDVFDIPDSMTDRTVNIFVSSTCFATPDGQCIGYVVDTVVDTTCFVCAAWYDTVCLHWEISAFPPCDSIYVSTDTMYVLDTTRVILNPGSITVLPRAVCGDLDGDGEVNVADLTYFVEWLFYGGPPPARVDRADIDGSGSPNVADLTYLVDYLFFGGPPPSCD